CAEPARERTRPGRSGEKEDVERKPREPGLDRREPAGVLEVEGDEEEDPGQPDVGEGGGGDRRREARPPEEREREHRLRRARLPGHEGAEGYDGYGQGAEPP